jgi:5-methylcytosine-specific restriction endonuclease McrA
MIKTVCKHCGKEGHSRAFCYSYRKTQPKARTTTIKPISERMGREYALDREDKLRLLQNTANINGYYSCYLRISPMCIPLLSVDQAVLEHVKPKGSFPELRHEPSNHKVSCSICNRIKGSRSLESLAKEHPHLYNFL